MRRLIFMIMEIKRNIADNHVSAYAAQAAYFIMLSLIPLLILLLSMIQFTGIGKADFYSLIQHLVPQGFQSWMLSIIDEMFSRTVATVSLSAVVTIWSAGKSFMALNRGFNAICRVDKNPNYVLMRLRGAVFALLFVVIIMVSLVLVVFGDSIHLWLVKYIPFVAVFTRIILSFRLFLMLAILTVFFAALYSMLPNRRSGFLDAWSFSSGCGLVFIFLWIFHLCTVWKCIQYVWQSDNLDPVHVLAVFRHVYCADRHGDQLLEGEAGERGQMIRKMAFP